MQPHSSQAIAKVARRPSATRPRQMQLHNLARRRVRSWLHRRVLAPGAAESPAKPVWGRVGAPERGQRPSERCSARGQVQRAPGRGRRARGATLTFGCLQISRGRCSAWLGHVSPRTRASLARHGALRAGHPRRGSPGSRGGSLGSGDLAGSAPAARPLHLRRPGPPGPAGPRAAARVRPGSATRSGRQRFGRLRGRPRVRSLAARRSQPQPPGSVLLRCPHLLQLSSARSRSPGREAGAEWGREREGSPCSRPRVPATPRSRAAGGEGAGAARPPPVRPAGTEAGGAPGPAGRGWGRRGAGRAACAGWAIWREWSGRQWGSPRPPTPEPELEEEVEGAAGGCRLRAGLHRGASSGFLGCRRRCAARELVESTLKPPLEQLEGGGPGVFLSGGVAGVAERWLPACQLAQPGVALKSWT